jgi:DNA-directed RNA polymerase specialized sigma24 family protein
MLGDEGSASVFEAFARAEAPRLFRLARLLCGNEHDAWDLTQEALVRIGRRWRSIDADRDPAAYARRCLVNVKSQSQASNAPRSADGLRSRGRREASRHAGRRPR